MDVVAFEFFKEFKYDLDFKNLKFNLVDWVGIYIFIKMKQRVLKFKFQQQDVIVFLCNFGLY